MQIEKIYIGNVIEREFPKYLCLNTNFYLDQNNNAVLLGSVYQLLKQKQPKLKEIYGNILKQNKYGVAPICRVGYNFLLAFPTRFHWKDETNIKLFRKSCCELYNIITNGQLIENIPIYLPIILENTTLTFDDLIDQADAILRDIKNLKLVTCWGSLNYQ